MQCRARGVLTNTCTMAPYRGVSRPVITFALERLMDKAAAAFGIDPVDIRRRNLIDKFPYTSATGLVFDEATYKQTLEMAVDAIDRAGLPRAAEGGARRRAAISASALRHFPSAPAMAARLSPRAAWRSRPAGRRSILSIDPSGFVEARIGSSPHGQGLRTTLAQIIADELGVAPERASRSCTATPTARPMAGAPSPAARW